MGKKQRTCMEHGADSAANTVALVQGIEAGDHLCIIYETDDEHRAVLTPYIRTGLERGERVLYVTDQRTAEAILEYLRSDGLDPAPFLENGRLVLLTADEAYLREGDFDPDRMIALLRSEEKRALEDGCTALRITGEMSWALKGCAGSERLIEYEAKLNDFFPGSKSLAVCQYDRRRFDAEILLQVLNTHPLAIIGIELYENFYFVPPADMLGPHTSNEILARWIQSLREHTRLQREIEQRETLLTEMGAMASVGGWKFDVATNKQTWTKETYRIHEVSEDYEPTVEKGIAFYVPSSRPLIEQAVRRTIDEGEPFDLELEIITATGRKRWIHAIGKAYQENGKTTRVGGTFQDITARRRAEERMVAVNACLMGLGSNYEKNVNAITKAAGEIMGSACALYNRLGGNLLCSVGMWNEPADFNPRDKPEGHICYDVIQGVPEGRLIICNLQDSPYAETDPNVRKYGLQTYIGQVVRLESKHIGSLCVVYQDAHEPVQGELDALGVLAGALGAEEARHVAVENLARQLNMVEKLNRFMLGRETRIIEMKHEINALLAELGRPLKFGV